MPQQRVNQLTPRRKKSDGGVLAQSSSSAAATEQQSSHKNNLQQNANDEEMPTRMIDTTNKSTTTTDKEMTANDNMSTSSSNTTEEDNSSSSDSDDDSQDSKQQPPNSNATNNTNSKSSQLTPSERNELSKTLTLPPNVNHINELSDYEILRLRNIQRNEAKLASLGLFAGITSKNGGVGNNKGKKKNVTPKSAAAIKAANTRRRNAEKAKLMIENHEKWQRSQQQISMELNGGGTNANTSTAIYASFKGSSTSYYRSQPSRTAKSKSISYTSNIQTTPKRIQQWHTNLSLLKQYHTQHQSYNISRTSNNGKYKPLADWLNRQRIQYNKYKMNEKHTLDNERISLLEGLNGVWWKRTRSNGGRKRGVSFGKSRGKDINIARQLWNERNQDMSISSSTDDTSILDKMEREVYSDSESEYGRLSPKKEEASYYYDSYSDDEYGEIDNNRRGANGMVVARSRRGYESEEDSRVEDYNNRKQPSIKKKRSNNNMNNTSSRRMSSMEQVAPPEKVSHHTRSPKRRRKSIKRRKRSNEDYYDQYDDDRRRRSYSPRHQSRHELDRRQRSSSSRRRPFYHDEGSLMSQEEEITSQEEEDTNSGSSLMIEEEHYIRRSSQKRKRVRRRSKSSDDYDYHNNHHNRHRSGSELVRKQKPMNEIIISPSNTTGTTAVAQSTTTTLSTLERNKLLAEYGKLYERQCYIYERKTRLELELRAIHSMLLENNRKSKSEMSSADIGIGMIGNGGMSIGGDSLVGNLGSANKLLTIGDKMN